MIYGPQRHGRLLPGLAAIYFLIVNCAVAAGEPLVIAHRGASGYLPEHTLAGKAIAHAMGADYLEQDVVLSGDGQPVILHDIYLNAVSNVAERYPGRARSDGKYYVIDFTLAELKMLSVHERVNLRSGGPQFPNRFPISRSLFRINTLEEELILIQSLNRVTARTVGVYVELKSPGWHREHGKDVTKVVIETLRAFGYDSDPSHAFIQSFDPAALKRLRSEFKTSIPLVQLVGENGWWPRQTVNYERMKTADGLREVAAYANGVGLWIPQLYSLAKEGLLTTVGTTGVVQAAHESGLVVHAYTARADRLPSGIQNFESLLDLLFRKLRVDGVFTDFPDVVSRFLIAHR